MVFLDSIYNLPAGYGTCESSNRNTMADDRISLYNLTIEVVLRNYITENTENLNSYNLPDKIAHDLIRESVSFQPKPNQLGKYGRKYSARKLRTLFNKIDLDLWIRLLKYEAYRKTMIQFYQRLYHLDCRESFEKDEPKIDEVIVKLFQEWTSDNDFCSNTAEGCITEHIQNGLILGSFFSEGAWYEVSERILIYSKGLCCKLPENCVSTYLIRLECFQKLFHTLIMSLKFDSAALVIEEIEVLRNLIDRCKQRVNYASLFAEYSHFNFLKNNFEESHKWIQKAMDELHEKLPVSIIIQVLEQASKVCVVKRDFNKAKYLLYQALSRAYQYYGPENLRLAGLLLDFGFYLLNSDQIEQSVVVYWETYSLRKKIFDYRSSNLLVAIAEEDLAYALYVQEYSTGNFAVAMKHAKRAIETMKKLLSPDNLMLASANRVKALILEEMTIDTYSNDLGTLNDFVNSCLLKEAEILHQDALRLTKSAFGEENILTAKHYSNLGRLYQSMRKYEEAEKLHLKAIKIKEKILGKNDYEVGLSMGHLASLYNYHMQKYEQAEELYHRSININLKLFSESYSGLEYDYRGLIHVYEHLNDSEQYLKFSNKLHNWIALQKNNVSERINPDFYGNIRIDSLETILEVYRVYVPSLYFSDQSRR